MGLAVRDALHWANAIVRTAPMAPDPAERFVAEAVALRRTMKAIVQPR